MESSLGDKRQDTQTAVKFLDDQIKRYEENLRASENKIKDFKLKYIGVSNRDAGLFFEDVAIGVRHRNGQAGAAGGRAGASCLQDAK